MDAAPPDIDRERDGAASGNRADAARGTLAHGHPEHAQAEHADEVHAEAEHADAVHADAVHGDEVHGEPVHGGRRGDTRGRIQRVALELFAEQGYERTSLREIAERLGVTKAALYYHFKSKEDIVHSFTEDHFSRLDALIAWGRDQPPGARTGHEILERYITILLDGSEVFLFLERNQASLGGSQGGKHRFEQFRPRLNALVEIITGPGAPPRSRIRAAAAIFAASTSCMFFMHETLETGAADPADASAAHVRDREELRKIILELSDDLTADLGPR
jgi:AcrR family transcriptional regulator